MDTAAIILAAGGSTRMGRPKQLIDIGGRTLLDRAIEVAKTAGCGPIVVVLGASFEAIQPTIARRDVLVARNANWPAGMGTSIRAGLALLQAVRPMVSRLFLMLVDQPHVGANVLADLAAEQIRTQRAACVCRFAGTLGPPVLVTAALFDRLAALPDESGGKAIWRDDPELIATVDCPAAAIDLDTPADVERLRSM